MVTMNCMCGGTLKSTGIMLEKQDELDWQLVAEQEVTASQALQPHIINKLELDDGKLYEYISNEINLKIYGLNSKDFEFIFVYFAYF